MWQVVQPRRRARHRHVEALNERCSDCAAHACRSVDPKAQSRSRWRLRSLSPSRGAGALLGTRMADTGGKSGRRPGTHLQVEASGLGDAASVQQRLAGRFRRGEVAEGCAGGAEGRSKALICVLGTWMRDTGGKSGRRPARHLQVGASSPGNAATVQQRLVGRFWRGTDVYE